MQQQIFETEIYDTPFTVQNYNGATRLIQIDKKISWVTSKKWMFIGFQDLLLTGVLILGLLGMLGNLSF